MLSLAKLAGYVKSALNISAAALTDNSGGAADTTVAAIAASTAQASTSQTQSVQTDNSGGTASTTLAAISNAVAGGVGLSSPSAVDVNTQLGIIRDAIASLAARLAQVKVDVAAINTTMQLAPTKASVDTILTAVKNNTADIVAQYNLLRANLR